MSTVVLAVDQGSSSSRCVAFDARLEPVALATRPLTTSFPAPGRVEHDASEIAGGVVCCMREALAQAGADWADVAGIGLTAQTETFVVWQASTGEPVSPAISWRDTRTAGWCGELRAAGHEAAVRSRTGLPLEAAFSAPKLRWLLDEVPGARAAAADGRLLFGDVCCWLIWRLTGGAVHVTDPSMASRTMLLDLAGGTWDAGLLDLFGVPARMLPAVVPTAGQIAVTDAAVCGGRATIGASAGDQQASLFGHRCARAGQAKLTLGTGAFLWCNAGTAPPASPPAGVVSTCAWQLGEQTSYALEGFVPNAGAVTSWLRRVGVLGPDEWPAIRPDAIKRGTYHAGPWCVPALFGLGTPSWAPVATAEIGGLTPDSTGAEVAEAAMVGVAHQIADAVEAVAAGLDGPLEVLRTDGGLGRNESVLQAIADLAGVRLEPAAAGEVTALGAAALAGIGTSLWGEEALAERPVPAGRAICPALPAADRDAARGAWAGRLADVLGRASAADAGRAP
jgi:glycerol kinase